LYYGFKKKKGVAESDLKKSERKEKATVGLITEKTGFATVGEFSEIKGLGRVRVYMVVGEGFYLNYSKSMNSKRKSEVKAGFNYSKL